MENTSRQATHILDTNSKTLLAKKMWCI